MATVDGTITRWLQCTNYGFAIPATATINGIRVNVERRSNRITDGGSRDAAMRAVKAGVIGTTDRSTATIYTTADVTETHGSASDLWGQTWTAAEINATNFGAAFSATKPNAAGNSHAIRVDVMSITVDYTVDTTPPTVSSISRVNPSPTGASSVDWAVTFSESVTGVDASDFSPAQAGGVSGATIASVTGSGTSWTVTVNTGSGSGTLGLNLVDNDSILDLAANRLGGTGAGNGNFTGQVYTVDKSLPFVNSINRAASDPTTASSVSWTVVFSEIVIGVDTADFALVTSGLAGTSITSVSGSGTTWTVTADTGSGTGTLGLNLVDNDTIIDSLSNRLGGMGAGNGNFTGQIYTVDRTGPAVDSINRADTNPSNADTVRWTVVFDESVTGVNVADFALVASGLSGAFVEAVTGSGTTWTVTANTGICAGTCTLGVNLIDDDTILDTLGNRLGGTGAGNGNFTGQVYSIASTPAFDLWSMDEASWNGTTDEVVDDEGGVPGTAFNNATTTTGTGSCRFGVFDNGATITQGGVVIPDFTDMTNDFTVTAWVRTTDSSVSGQRIFVDDATNTGGYGLSLGDGGTGMLRFYARGSSVIILDSAAVINNNTWYFVAGVADIANGVRRVYVFDASGALLSATNVASTGWGTDAGDASIGAETVASGEPPASFHFRGNLDEVGIYDKVLTQQALATLAQSRTCATAGPNHLQIEHGSGSGVTCTPSTLTIRACADAAPSCTPYTGGVTGIMTKTGTPTVNWSGGGTFAIPAGSSTTTKDVQVTTAGSVVFGISSLSPVPSSATTCNFGSPGCTFTSALAGFLVSAPNHVSCTSQALTVRAVRQSDSGLICVPAFASTSKSATISVAYSNPTTGTRVPVVGGTSVSTAGVPVTLTFDATGTATPALTYNDVGQIGITVAYAGSGGTETGLSMTGTAPLIAAPSSFGFSGITAAPITAGANFNATVTALNACGSPAATPNFGRELTTESVALSFTRTVPTGGGVSNGVFSGSVGAFAGGSASGTNLNWSEVGQGTLAATLVSANYLGSGLTATGTSATVGRFRPAYFNTAVTVPGCSTFTYSGQPFTVTVTANKQGGGTTVNYSGAAGFGTSNATTLSDANGGTGTWANNILATTDFVAGVGTKSTASYNFASRQTAPTAIAVRAVESAGTDLVSSLGHIEGTTTIYSGRFRLANAYGSERLPLSILAQAEYHNGLGWAVNSADNCTSIPLPVLTPNPVALSTTASYANNPLLGGLAGLSLAAPGGGTGYVDLAINVPDYLEFMWRSTTPSDPSARATFGIFKGNERLIYRRERY